MQKAKRQVANILAAKNLWGLIEGEDTFNEAEPNEDNFITPTITGMLNQLEQSFNEEKKVLK